MTPGRSGHRCSVRRYLWPAVVICVILLVLGIMLAIGIIRGDDTDIERRQEEPENSAPLLP
jgi:hypothetical protein